MNKEYIAILISRTFDIYTIFPVIISICFGYSLITTNIFIDIAWALFFLFILVLIPVFGDLYLTKKGKITDWDISDRKQRIQYIDIDVFLTIVVLVSVLLFNAPVMFKLTSLLLFGVELVFAIVTLFSKISGHAQMITLLAIYSTVFLGIQYISFFLLVPVVFWARIYLKKHTLNQLLAGSLVTLAIAAGVLKVFGYY